MPCDTRMKRGQSIKQRVEEVKKIVTTVDAAIASGRVKVRIGPQGAISFVGITDQQRDDVTDACIYRRIMSAGSALAKQQIMRAQQIYGRAINDQAIAQGHHSHDGGTTWHKH